jgi:hypothetical protein
MKALCTGNKSAATYLDIRTQEEQVVQPSTGRMAMSSPIHLRQLVRLGYNPPCTHTAVFAIDEFYARAAFARRDRGTLTLE